ncbi:hypothetical protein HMPREF0742_02276 [Rothia aeria F0184]|uniref:Uncharacterized protein n=1 Tax=Rothia aeria F0184 TaxID=888019 RepID=U7UYH8_9MICC|nr:hypothetical protein HMPREF0742_02276 [Rothia aeria F0184]
MWAITHRRWFRCFQRLVSSPFLHRFISILRLGGAIISHPVGEAQAHIKQRGSRYF